LPLHARRFSLFSFFFFFFLFSFTENFLSKKAAEKRIESFSAFVFLMGLVLHFCETAKEPTALFPKKTHNSREQKQQQRHEMMCHRGAVGPLIIKI
jgi:hypothetical protein